MKKTLVTMVAAVAFAAASYGQGTINFVNTAGSLIQIDGVNATAAQGVKIELLGAAPGVTDAGLFQLAGAAANVGVPLAGRFSGGIRTINGIAPGGAASILVRAYVGESYETANVRGISSILSFASTGNPLSEPPGTAAALVDGGFTGLNLTIVPEPSSMALAGLGAAALVFFRRRK
jgi:hypothetical protein